MAGKVQRAREDAAARAIVDVGVGVGMQQRDSVLIQCPAVVQDVCSFSARPFFSTTDTLLNWLPPFGSEVPRMLGTLCKAPVSESHALIMDRLLANYYRDHEMYRHADQAPLPKMPRKKQGQKARCSDAGMCLCGVRGDAIWKYNLWLLSLFKRALLLRAVSLNDGFIVVRVFDLSSFGNESVPDTTTASVTDAFFHVALLYRKPYRPTYRRLVFRSCLPNGNVMCRASHDYNTCLEHCAFCIDRYMDRWGVQFYEAGYQPCTHVCLYPMDNCNTC
jgi:hypothetical protein